MLLQGSISSDKTQKLVEEYAKLLNSGVDSSKILVILQNSNKKNQFIEETLNRLTIDAIEKLQVYSFFGLVYNTISDNWAKIENKIPDEKNTKILPNLTGLEISQFIMREIISEIKFEGYNSKKSLLHQLFRRYSLIVQNNLSDADVQWRSEEVLRESFAPDAKKALDEFKKKTLEARALDYLRQSLIFNYIYQSSDYFSKIEYLFVDDGDEITPICFDFIKYLKPQLKDVFIAYDKDGSSRVGYLSADKSAGARFEELFEGKKATSIPSLLEGEEIFQHEVRVLEKSGGGQKTISRLYTKQSLEYAIELRKNMTDAEYTLWYFLRNEQMNGVKFRKQSPIGSYIVDFVSFEKKVVIELDGGQHCEEEHIKQDKIRDNFLKNAGYTVLRFFNNEIFQNIEGVLQVIYDNTTPHPNPPPQGGRENSAKQNCPPSLNSSFTIHHSLFTMSKRAQMLEAGVQNVKKLIENGIKPCDIAIVTPIIDDMLKFSLKESFGKRNLLFLSGSEKIVQNPLVLASLTTLKLCDNNLKNDLDSFDTRAILDFLQIPLRHCKEILENFDKAKSLIKFEFAVGEYSEKYKKFLSVLENLKNFEKLSEQVYEIYENLVDIENFTPEEITKFNFFIKQLEDFENVFGSLNKSEIINQIENSITSENSYSMLDIKTHNLIVATPQKIIDNQIQTKYQIWFDVSSDEWIKSDTGPLYNAWVFQAGWDKPEYLLQDNIELSRQKTARILRKLTLCSSEKIYAYASLFDGSGIENFGGIEKYLLNGMNGEREIKAATPQRQFTPREDQRPVLDYKKGKMAISAVPGAGKTTILLALIIKLLNDGIKPENIFVLTYMESAARNFRERIQNANQELPQLPNISTIHGLALKILKENANFEKLGLNADFEICDDTQRSRILREIGAKLEIKKTELEDFDRAVSILKIGGGGWMTPSPLTHDKKLAKFLEFFKEYKTVLQVNNLIDYDDMLIFSVKLLEENPDILKYYQEICHYVIEDEAQDSSAIQQKLIELLSGKHKNLIRCGDINQAITTTFSNADVEGFRQFIEQSETRVSMNCSQRCAKDVWELANELVCSTKEKPETKNAFYQIFMKPVEGKNPDSENGKGAIKTFVLENEFVEKNYILKQIKELLSKNPKATVGILLRNNFQVASWTKFINNAGMKTITRSECLEQKGIFRTIFAVLKIILNPFDNENLAENYDILAELGHCESNLYQLIKNYPKPFIQECVDDIENVDLAEFYWQVIHWLSFSSLPAEEIAIKVGFLYYSSDIEKSNVYLISTLIKRLSNSYKKYSILIERLGELSKKPNLSGFKFFSEEEKSDREILEGKVQIMTLHKSKGDEFDYVFLPEMTENSLPLAFENVSLKKNARFMESVRELNPIYCPKTDDELKEFLLAENLRLMYVAITRAQQKLFITANKSAKYNKAPKLSVIFEQLGC